MENFRYKTDKEQLLALGDIHGNFAKIEQICYELHNVCIVQLGDFGIGFYHTLKESSRLRALNRILHKENNELIVCRGNHDDPAYFANQWRGEEILLVDDYARLDFKDKKIQLIGGGISIDRSDRVVNRSWWLGEELKFRPEKVEKVDILITHVAPLKAGLTKAECNPTVMHYNGVEAMQGGESLLQELHREQHFMQELSDVSECKVHYFGHYHVHHYFVDPTVGRKYIGLEIDGVREIR